MFGQKSQKTRKKYLKTLKALYGNLTPNEKIDFKPSPRNTVKRKPSTPYEYQGQMALVKWARYLGLPLISIPNGGSRTPWAGQKERAMGLRVGVSDLFLAIPNSAHHGFWIEMKRKGSKPNPYQLEWLKLMQSHNYKAEWYDDWEVAKCDIEKYLKTSHTYSLNF
jgi:hypothetical protein